METNPVISSSWEQDQQEILQSEGMLEQPDQLVFDESLISPYLGEDLVLDPNRIEPRTEKTELPYEIIEKVSADLECDQRLIIQPGVPGHLIELYEDTYLEGVLTNSRLLSRAETYATAELVLVGTKQVERRKRVEEKPLSFETEYKTDPNLEQGKEVVDQEGQLGMNTLVYEDILDEYGQITSSRMISDHLQPAVDRIVRIGTQVIEQRQRRVTEPLSFTTVRTKDPSLAVGIEIEEQAGQAGSVDKIYEDTYVNNVLTLLGENPIREENRIEPRVRLVRIGSKVED